MSKPTVLAVSQLEAAATAAVAAAVEDRTIGLTEQEARATSGGAITPIVIEPTTLGMRPPRPLEPWTLSVD